MKKLLFATTALVAIGALASGAVAASRTYPVRDNNQTFLCDYGFVISSYVACLSSSCYHHRGHWQRAAVPVIGTGKTVSNIEVADSSVYSSNAFFNVGLYSSVRNRPGNNITGVKNLQASQCGVISVQITPTYLAKGVKYWIVESASTYYHHGFSSGSSSVVWLYDKKHTKGALYQNYSYDACKTCKWQKLVGRRPYARVR